MSKTPILYTDEGEKKLPTKWEICPECRGAGKSSAYLGSYTQSEMDEWGPEFFEEYMSGDYDRKCEVCNGTGKIQVVDEELLSEEDQKAYAEQLREERSEWQEREMERRMGA